MTKMNAIQFLRNSTIFALLAIFLMLAASSQVAAEVGDGTISGRVTMANGGAPVADLHVFAQDFDTGIWTEGTNTDASGDYTLVVPTGSFRVQACADCSRDNVPANLLNEWYQESVTQDGASPGISCYLGTLPA